MSKNRNRSHRTGRYAATALILQIACYWIAGCGVKADPSPPEKSPFIGRGKPTYRDAMKGLKPFDKKTIEESEDEESE